MLNFGILGCGRIGQVHARAIMASPDARVAAELEVDPRLEEINDLFEVIETERDAEIDRLLAEFFAAVEEIENGLS